MTNGVYDESLEEIDTLMEISMATDLLVNMANSLQLGATSFDSQMILHGANVTMNVMKAAVNKVIDTTFPFIKWIGKIIKITVIVILLIVLMAISYKFWRYCYTNQKKQERKNNIAQFLSSLNQRDHHQETITQE